MHKNFLFYFVLYLFFTVVTNAQTDTKKLHHLPNQRSADLVYLQTNKDIYLAQEDLWLKGYVLDAQLFLLSPLSDILFVQLINDKTSNVVWEEKYNVENGFVDGHVYLHDNLESGDYSLQAYTSHSFFKDSKEFYALKKIKIQAAIENNITNDQPKNHEQEKVKDAIQFATFPEGGHLVSGLENNIAFKAINSSGYPVEISGNLYENDSVITSFKSAHAGMGSFIITPNHSKKYHIKLWEGANQIRYDLPKIKKQGKAMQLVSQTREHAIFKITQSPQAAAEQIVLRLQVRGNAYLIASTSLKNESLIKVPLEDIPQGIAEVTLFNEGLEPIAERLLYINLDQQLNIKTTLNKERFQTREKVNLKVEVTDQHQQPVVAHLGLSVFDKFYKNDTDSKNILTHYYLSSQLKGKIYDPAYYFDKKNKTRRNDLNLLLLTQGWRRYLWSETNLKKKKTHNYTIVSDTLSGNILSSKRKMNDTKLVTVTSGNDNSKTTFIEVENNNFKVSRNHLKIGAQGYIYLKPVGKHDSKEYKINIEDKSFDSINKYRYSKTTYYPNKKKQKSLIKKVIPFNFNSQINNLDEIVIKTKKKNTYRNKFLGRMDSLRKLSLDPPPVCICHNGILNCKNHCRNEATMSGINLVKSKIATKRFIEEQQNYSETDLLKMYSLTKVRGLYAKREFYSMTYDEFSIDDPMPDPRSTLFWKPDIITNDNGEATVEFYCSDTNAEFIIATEGIGGQGLIGSHNHNFRVDKRTQ